jgi:hypothetical protein
MRYGFIVRRDDNLVYRMTSPSLLDGIGQQGLTCHLGDVLHWQAAAASTGRNNA